MWTLERVQDEVQIFADIAKDIIDNDKIIDELKKCPVEISLRMTKTKGYFTYQTYSHTNGKVYKIKPLKIVIAQNLLDYYQDEDIVDVIRHECIHLIVNVLTVGKHTGHGEIFKRYCRRLGVPDNTYFTAKPKTDIKPIIKKVAKAPKHTLDYRYIAKCKDCGHEYHRKIIRKDSVKKWLVQYYCHKCEGGLQLIDNKENVEYVLNSKFNVDTIKLTKVSNVKNKEKLMSTMRRTIAYKLACEYSEYIPNDADLDFFWWELLRLYDNEGYERLSKLQLNNLYKWLTDSQQYTIEYKDVKIQCLN